MKQIVLLIIISIMCYITQGQILIPKVDAPTINGKIDPDDPWMKVSTNYALKVRGNTDTSVFKGNFKIAYDDDNLFLYAEIIDATDFTDNAVVWQNDCVELFLAMDTTSGETGAYKAGDYQLRATRGKEFPEGFNGGGHDMLFNDGGAKLEDFTSGISGVKIKQINKKDGYSQEWQLPWTVLCKNVDFTPLKGQSFKFDLQFADNTGSQREGQLFFFGNSDQQSRDTRVFGIGTLGVSVTSIEKTDNDPIIYPSITNGEIRISGKIKEINIFNLSGIKVLKYSKLSGENHYLNLSQLRQGMYLINGILTDGTKWYAKVFKY